MDEQVSNVERVKNLSFEDVAYHRNHITWFASYPKSGNTWLRAFWNSYARRGGQININRLDLTYSDQDPYSYQAVSPLPLQVLTDAEKLAIRPAALFHFITSGRVPLGAPCVMKTHCRYDPFLIPTALTHRVVYLVRDPRDIAVSYAKYLGLSIDEAIVNMAQQNSIGFKQGWPLFSPVGSWSQNVLTWSKNLLEPQRVMFIRYEDLRAEPAKWFQQIVEHVGIEFDAKILNKAIEQSSLSVMRAQEAAMGFSENPVSEAFFNKGAVGGWSKVLTKEQVRTIHSGHQIMMQRLGYL